MPQIIYEQLKEIDGKNFGKCLILDNGKFRYYRVVADTPILQKEFGMVDIMRKRSLLEKV